MITQSLMHHLITGFALGRDSDHGPAHWARVRHNGQMLATETPGADRDVVQLFAVLHDSQRQNEWEDPDHGPRAARLAEQLQGQYFDLDRVRLGLLIEACRMHDRGGLSDDPTIGVCFDADRLDLGRVGIIPDPKRLSTVHARRPDVIEAALARSGFISPQAEKLRT
jgi:uncharacterized protein